jgi:hypothetical protein
MGKADWAAMGSLSQIAQGTAGQEEYDGKMCVYKATLDYYAKQTPL